MDLALNEIQQMLKTSAREVLAQECSFEVVRAMELDDRGYTPELWGSMTDLGWLGLVVPEKFGGAGGSFLDLGVLLEEMGRGLTPGPFFSTVVLGALTVMDGGDEALQSKLLPGIASGETRMTLAVTEERGGFEAEGIRMEARREGEEFVLSGRKFFMPDAHVADYAIVAARTSAGSDGREGITLFVVPMEEKGIVVSPHATMTLEKQSQVDFDGVRISADSVLGEIGEGWPVLERALERAATAKGLEMVGGAEAVLEMTLDYVKDRVQFGRPVGTFQALQHHCANMAIDLEGSRYAVYQAASRISEGLPASREVSVGKAWVSDAYMRVCEKAVQCHGAVGFTAEHDLQLFVRRARVQEQLYGDAGFHRRRLAAGLRG